MLTIRWDQHRNSESQSRRFFDCVFPDAHHIRADTRAWQSHLCSVQLCSSVSFQLRLVHLQPTDDLDAHSARTAQDKKRAGHFADRLTCPTRAHKIKNSKKSRKGDLLMGRTKKTNFQKKNSKKKKTAKNKTSKEHKIKNWIFFYFEKWKNQTKKRKHENQIPSSPNFFQKKGNNIKSKRSRKRNMKKTKKIIKKNPPSHQKKNQKMKKSENLKKQTPKPWTPSRSHSALQASYMSTCTVLW